MSRYADLLLLGAFVALALSLFVGKFNGASLVGVFLAGAAIRGYVKRAGEAS